MKPITVPRGVSRPSSSGSLGPAAGVADGAVAGAGTSGVVWALTHAWSAAPSAGNSAHILTSMKIELAANLCISPCAKKGPGWHHCIQPAAEITSCLGSPSEPLACRGRIPEMVALPAQQELVGHARDVIADRDVARLRARQLLMWRGHGARRMQIILE